jgi:crotonobetainyl-CoA:carnitine CoA-transferase CaiB-like acyl-CoA transferase
VTELEAALAARSANSWEQLFRQHNAKFAYGRINNVQEAFNLDQVREITIQTPPCLAVQLQRGASWHADISTVGSGTCHGSNSDHRRWGGH